MFHGKDKTLFRLLPLATVIGVILWLYSPRRRQPEWLGKLLLQLGPSYFRWHVRRVVAVNKERSGQMKARDYLRVVAIGERIGQTISDRDLAELLRIMSQPSEYPQIIHGHVASRLLDVPSLSEPQKERVFRAFYPLLSLENPGDIFFLHQQQGIKIMRHLGDRRAIPHLMPLLQHPREKVRLRAAETLATLGHS